MGEATSPRRFSSPSGGWRTDAADRSARGLDRLRALLERECEAQVGLHFKTRVFGVGVRFFG